MPTSKILVIDDEPQVTEIIEAFLVNAGHEVFIDNDAVSGVTQAKKHKPNLILLDIMMPGMDGYTLCTELKRIPKHPISRCCF